MFVIYKALFGGSSSAPPPQPQPTAPMPDPDSPAVQEARRRRLSMITARGGRRSTVLTDPEDRGDSYSKTHL